MSSGNSFDFQGQIPASKSIFNRLLIVQSFFPHLQLIGHSQADDVIKMKSALASVMAAKSADCGAAGTTLRFLALRASRLEGRHILTGSERLFQRPQSEILRLLNQLGCRAEVSGQELTIDSHGWNYSESGITLDRSVSSQFASGVILSAWNLLKPLRIQMSGEMVSEGYLTMTLELVKRLGMNWVRESSDVIIVPAFAKPSDDILNMPLMVEPDLSSAFAIAALAAVSGRAEIQSWPEKSLQPDRIFAEILKVMSCAVERKGSSLVVESPQVKSPGSVLKAIKWNISDSPDLFPVLSVLCALSNGHTHLFGAPHLAYKESNRIDKTAELLKIMGVAYKITEDGIEIDGPAPRPQQFQAPHAFDPVHDHRLAMAASLARQAGYAIEIMHPEVVNKSFPEYWSILRASTQTNRSDQR